MLPLFSDLLESFQRKELLALQQRLIDTLDEAEFDVELAANGVLTKYKHVELSKSVGGRELSDTLFVPWIGNDKMVGIIRNGSQKPIFFDSVTKQMNETAQANRFIASRPALKMKTDEGLKHAVAAGVLAAASLTGSAPKERTDLPQMSQSERSSEQQRLVSKQKDAHERNKKEARARELAQIVTDKYAVGSDFALQVAHLAMKHEKPSFPKAEDLLAVIGIESSFNPSAQSKLKTDPAIGLTQIRPAVWGLNAAKLKGSIENQVKLGADILHKYYAKLKTPEKALHAYNIGLTNFMKQKGLNPRYVQKFDKERDLYEGIDHALRDLLKWQQEIAEHTDVTITIPSSKEGLLVTGPDNLFKWLLVINANPKYESGANVEVYESGAKDKPRLAGHGLGEIIYVLRSYEELCKLLPTDILSKCTPSPWSIKISGRNGDKFIINFETPDQADATISYGFEHKKGNKRLDGAGSCTAAEIVAALKRCIG